MPETKKNKKLFENSKGKAAIGRFTLKSKDGKPTETPEEGKKRAAELGYEITDKDTFDEKSNSFIPEGRKPKVSKPKGGDLSKDIEKNPGMKVKKKRGRPSKGSK